MALLGVTGLDVLYVLILYLKYRIVLSDMEVWDTDQVTSWTNSLLWVPHHVAATSACMLGFVFLWHAGRPLEHYPTATHPPRHTGGNGLRQRGRSFRLRYLRLCSFPLRRSSVLARNTKIQHVGLYTAVAMSGPPSLRRLPARSPRHKHTYRRGRSRSPQPPPSHSLFLPH